MWGDVGQLPMCVPLLWERAQPPEPGSTHPSMAIRCFLEGRIFNLLASSKKVH